VQSFADIVELVEYHKTHNIILMGQNGGETRLVKHPKKWHMIHLVTVWWHISHFAVSTLGGF